MVRKVITQKSKQAIQTEKERIERDRFKQSDLLVIENKQNQDFFKFHSLQ